MKQRDDKDLQLNAVLWHLICSRAKIMDTHTLLVMNVLLYVLYACVIVVNARTVGIAKGALWFAGANLSRAAGLLVIGLNGLLPMSTSATTALGSLLAVCGIAMLYFSFIELLERGPILRSLQYALIAVMFTVTLLLLIIPAPYPATLLLAYAIEAVQIAATATVVFLFSGEEIGPAAWLTGGALSLYAFLLLMRAGVTLRFNTPTYSALTVETTRVWLVGSLVTNSAITFGFIFLSSAKLRLELLWHAQADELTGLLNRWALRRIALREISRCGRTKDPVSVLMMDLDGLKKVNDSLGHGCGDAVLQAIAGVLRETVRDQDAVARIGGDEFCILLPDTGLTEAATVAERLRSQIDDMILQYKGQSVRVFASLGVSSSDECGLSWQKLLEQSDIALYRAKREGKNRVVIADLSRSLGESGLET